MLLDLLAKEGRGFPRSSGAPRGSETRDWAAGLTQYLRTKPREHPGSPFGPLNSLPSLYMTPAAGGAREKLGNKGGFHPRAS